LHGLGWYEAFGVKVREWSSEPLPNRVDEKGWRNPTKEFPYEIFARCKRIISGKGVLDNNTGIANVGGLIRALVQHYQPYTPFAQEPAPLSWWRTTLDEEHLRRYEYDPQAVFDLGVVSLFATVSA
jgi:hypothetical protein